MRDSIQHSAKPSLGPFIGRALAFAGMLMVLAFVQQLVLWQLGAFDTLVNQSLFLAWVHQLGYAALVSIVLVLLYKKWRKQGVTAAQNKIELVFVAILDLELFQTAFFVREGLPFPMGGLYAILDGWYIYLPIVVLGFFLVRGLYPRVLTYLAGLTHWVGRMFPVTLVMLSMFLCTYTLGKRALYENKTQFLVEWLLTSVVSKEGADAKLDRASLIAPSRQVFPFSKYDRLWLQHAMYTDDLDLAYLKARQLGFDKKFDRAALLASYIVYYTPEQLDAKILLGRIYAWQRQFEKAEPILMHLVAENPNYQDAYSALFDVFLWSGEEEKALPYINSLQNTEALNEDLNARIKKLNTRLAQLAQAPAKGPDSINPPQP